jgi:hypothetical protein
MARPYRQFPRRRGPIVPLPSVAPVAMAWIHPVNQPLRGRVPKRLQVNKAAPPFPALPSVAPVALAWKQPTNEPLKNRVPKRQQPAYGQVPPLKTAELPQFDAWKQPINQPLKSRVLKRQQPQPPKPPSTPLPSVAPAGLAWKQPTQQPLRRVKRQQPPSTVQNPFYGLPAAPAAPSVAGWKQPVNEPLKSRMPKRMQVDKAKPPFPALPSVVPNALSWVQPTNQPLRSRISRRQQPQYGQVPVLRTAESPKVSSWGRPISQPVRNAIRRRQQPQSTRYNPFYSIPVNVVVPSVASWIHPVNQPRNIRGRQRYARTPYPFPTPIVQTATYNSTRMLLGFGL